MKLFLSKLSIIVFLISAFSVLHAQKANPYENDINTIRQYDEMYEIPANPIVFVGSSSIRKWKTLQLDFGRYNVINRGIGGAVTNDIICYAQDLIFKYHPREIVIYVGENDLTLPNTTVDTIFTRFKKLYTLIRSQLPDIPICYISIKPSPSRVRFYQTAKAANKRILDFIKTEKNIYFIDVFSPMSQNGKPREDLFVSDRLHMNASGYRIWAKLLKPYLEQSAK